MKTLLQSGIGALATTLLLCQTAGAQAPVTLTAEDRTAIQALVTGYARALGACAAEEFADLFAYGGYFASGFRGQISGREKLIALVQSERHCITAPGEKPAARPGGGSGPTVSIQVTSNTVRGIADLGTAGEYQDEYVKTPQGWRFVSRTVIIPAEKAAGLDAAEMLAIQRMAGPELGDYYAPDQNGVRRLRTAGVAISITTNAVHGRAYLKNGYCDDVYDKLGPGQWRIKSRTCTTSGP
jgi:hypothetical protein